MKSLSEKVREGMSAEEQADVLLQLIDHVEHEKEIGNDPGDVMLGEDNEVTCRPSSISPNRAYAPPETVSALAAGNAEPVFGKPQRWFQIGMLAWFMARGKDYYSASETSVLTEMLPESNLDGRESLFRPQDVANVPFGDALRHLTAVDSGARVQGVRELLVYFTSNMPETAVIQYVSADDGTVVDTEERQLRRDIENLATDGKLAQRGASWQLASPGAMTIPYRPGRHTYRVMVKPSVSDRVTQSNPQTGTARRIYISRAYDTGLEADREKYRVFLDLEDGAASELLLRMSYPSCEFFLCEGQQGGQMKILKRFLIRKPSIHGLEKYRLYMHYEAQGNAICVELQDVNRRTLSQPSMLKL